MDTKTPPARKPNLTDILSKSETILISNYTHFITLSLLFLPLSISLITSSPLFAAYHFNLNSITFSYVFYLLIVYLLSLCVVAMITYSTCYSTHHGLSSKHKQVNLMLPDLLERPWYRRRMLETFTAFKSLTSSFFPVVMTGVISHGLLILVMGMIYFIVATTRGSSFTWLSTVIVIVIVTYFHVNWWLAFVVAVVESKWGFAALRRSSCLVKGMRTVSLLLFLYFVSFVWISVWVLSDGVRSLRGSGYELFAMMFGSIWLMSYLRHITVATAVLYNYCRDFHGECEA